MRLRNVPERYDIDQHRGNDLVIPLSAADRNGAPIDLSTHVIVAEIKHDASDETPAETLDLVLEATQGNYLLVLPQARLAALPFDPTPHTDGSKYVWFVKHTIPGVRTKTPYEGTLTLIADLSQA